MIFYPGGGYITGNLDTEDCHCRIYAAKVPCLVISVNYPKIPHVKLDGIIDFATEAVPWVGGLTRAFDSCRLADYGVLVPQQSQRTW